ncbi:MAG: hypothetical protein KIT09_24745 [Bryobacteraceae bacterium]|nr:hypothetical protein [Bryobacteraceae bacterium]
MSGSALRLAFGLGLLFAGGCAAEVVDLSGVWRLNLEKSRWGKVPKPVSIVVTIEHREPAIHYSGKMIYVGGEETRDFEFAGTIDGKEYPAARTFGDGKVVVKRENDTAISSEFRSNDGRWEEKTRTTVTRDRKVMRRMIERKGPDEELAWMEYYEKQ